MKINDKTNYRTFTVIVLPEYFEVDSIKEATFKFTEDELVDVSRGQLLDYFFEVVSTKYKAKQSTVIHWFENEK